MFMQQLTLRVEERLESFGLTSRQWLLLGVIEKAFPGYAPTISEATAVFGSSRQNVKLVDSLDAEFGRCSTHGECVEVCPASIPLAAVAAVNRERLGAAFRRRDD